MHSKYAAGFEGNVKQVPNKERKFHESTRLPRGLLQSIAYRPVDDFGCAGARRVPFDDRREDVEVSLDPIF